MTKRLEATLQIPRQFWGVTLDQYVGDDEEALAVVQQYIDELPEHIEGDGKGLLIVGGPGSGKTLFASAVLLAVGEKGSSGAFQLIGDYFKLLRDIMSYERVASRTGDTDSMLEWERLRDWHLKIRNKLHMLVLDDIGKEHATDSRWAEDEIDLLLRHRYNKGLPTVLTSNRPVDRWGGAYNESMVSFIHEAFVIVAVLGDDYRLAGR